MAAVLVSKDRRGNEVWAKHDGESGCYELFASEECDDYLGVTDTIKEARDFAAGRFQEIAAGVI